MWFQQLIREETGCATYLVGSLETDQCAVFDPLWDIQPYLSVAGRKGATISHVIDSHSHADHVSGAGRVIQICALSNKPDREVTVPPRGVDVPRGRKKLRYTAVHGIGGVIQVGISHLEVQGGARCNERFVGRCDQCNDRINGIYGNCEQP